MEIHQIGGTFYDSNIYLIKAKRPMVIDTGTGSHHNEVVKNLKKVLNPKDVETIILTHRHFDHTGGAEGLQSELDADLLVHETAADPLRQGDDVTTAARAFGKSFPKLDVKALKEGDVLDLGDLTLQVLHTPGHSICSIALYHEESKTIFSGDTVYTDGGIGRWDLPTGNYEQLVASIRRLTEMEVKTLYPGHGPSSIDEGFRHIALGLKSALMWG
ncbi:MAG: MBL fold metallo-hydrolase [Thermoplasmata archaeon]|nr:MAG: MBL fold metallo-hydrolase [Thermoplasmata archaeon]